MYAIQGILVPRNAVGSRMRLISKHYIDDRLHQGDYRVAVYKDRASAQQMIDTQLIPQHHPSVMIFSTIKVPV